MTFSEEVPRNQGKEGHSKEELDDDNVAKIVIIDKEILWEIIVVSV